MYCILQVFTKGKPDGNQLEKLMDPFYEHDFYNRYYDPDTDEFQEIPPEDFPMFTWDYWNVWDPPVEVDVSKIGDCFAMIDKQGRAHVRTRWNGQEHEDLTKDFKYWIRRIQRESRFGDYMTVIDYHY